ncbi:MAG: TraB/GumN family protein [Thermoplasmata archaeon]|nr:TraB/GumN family protein [Thermoplasmata archaeon]
MITLVGVGHVFAISDRVNEVICSRRPDVVCLELDPARYQSLLQKDGSRRVPMQYSLLAMFQKRMAGKFGSEVGGEMLAAASAARAVGARVTLIDVDSSRMLATLWKKMSVREKCGLLFSALVGLVSSKETVEKEMEMYQSDDEAYIERIGEMFPTVKAVLIDDRNRIMAERIKGVAKEHANVVVIIGDGHVPGIARALEAEQLEVVRLKQLMSATPQPDNFGEHSTSFVWNHPYG